MLTPSGKRQMNGQHRAFVGVAFRFNSLAHAVNIFGCTYLILIVHPILHKCPPWIQRVRQTTLVEIPKSILESRKESSEHFAAVE